MNESDYSESLELIQALNGPVNLRLLAESKELKEKVSRGEARSVFKLLAYEAPLEARLAAAVERNKQGYGVFYLPNEALDGADESRKSLKYIRAFVLDLDDGENASPIEDVENCELPPSYIVETSAGKYQCVWILDQKLPIIATKGLGEGITFDDAEELAGELANKFGGDASVAKATQVFRLPGFLHQKGASYESRLINAGNKVGGDISDKRTGTRCKYQDFYRFVKLGARENIGGQRDKWRDTSSIRGHVRPNKTYQVTERAKESNVNGNRQDLRGSSKLTKTVEMSLDQIRLGQGYICQGQRHNLLVPLAEKFYFEGMTDEEVKCALFVIIDRDYAEPELFHEGGGRYEEVLKAIRDAKEYYLIKKEEEQAYKKAEIERILKTESNGETTLQQIAESFKYDFSSGVLRANKYTETAIAERCLQKFGHDLARIDNRVFCFNGLKRLWIEQTSGRFAETKERILSVVHDAIHEEEFFQKLCTDSKGKLSESKRHIAIAQLEKSNAVNTMTKAVLNNMRVTDYSYSDFDSNENLVYLSNGVLNMDTLEFREAQAQDRLLRQSFVEWKDLNCKCEGWCQFLSEVFPGSSSKEMIDFIQELFGYSLSGSIREEKIFCHYGQGANGKSKLLSALSLISGGYGTFIEPDELATKKNGFVKSFERTGSKVEGRRLALIDDLDITTVWNEGFVKTLTAKNIRARAEYEQSRTVANRCKFHIGLNKAPEPESENLGILRRLCIIPYNVTFQPIASSEKRLSDMIEAEASGILAWSVEGYRRWLRQGGLAYPEETRLAIEDYKHEHFKLESAINDMIVACGEDDKAGEWVDLSVLCDQLNANIEASDSKGMRISNQELGTTLKLKMGFLYKRKNINKKTAKITMYLVKYLGDKPETKNLLE